VRCRKGGIMKYVGSKNRLKKELIPIIQSYITDETEIYLEPFVGGCNVIDKIVHTIKTGCDIHKELIALLKYASDLKNVLPTTITKDEYVLVRDNKQNYPNWYVGLVGFCASYNAKYFGGYAGECKTKEGIRHYDREAIRNLEKQRPDLKGINFLNESFESINMDSVENSVIYCDIPYRDTTDYKTSPFPYDKFYDWCEKMSCFNTVLISEYHMPEDRFECIWSKQHKTSLDNKSNKKIRIEKLFIVKTR
jgi:site-specific DNA-adenine methylase